MNFPVNLNYGKIHLSKYFVFQFQFSDALCWFIQNQGRVSPDVWPQAVWHDARAVGMQEGFSWCVW